MDLSLYFKLIKLSKIINFSEAASIGIHSMVLIAKSNEVLNVIKISEFTGTSKPHVAKVLQRLVKDNFLNSPGGPAGGFILKKPAEEISLLNIYEAIDGAIEISECPMDNLICPMDKCLMGNVVNSMTLQIRSYLESQKLSDYLNGPYKVSAHIK
jgi:Rrf2 family protein